MTKEDGTVLSYTYGDGARLTQIDVSNAPGIVIGTTQQTFDYSDLGRAEATDNNDPALGDDNVTAAWLHDSLGRTIEESQKIAVGRVRRYVSYNYESMRRESLIYPNGRKVEYTYHDSGALNTIEDDGTPDVVIAEYEYLGGRVLQRNMQNGVDLDMTNGSGTYFDHLGRPDYYEHQKSGVGTVIGFYYEYDAAGNKTMQKSSHDATDSQRYSYDSANRLTAYVRGAFADFCDPVTANPPSGETQARRWTLDGLGNWDQLVTKVSGSSTTEDREDTTFNEYSTIDPDGAGGSDPIAQSHDTNGNLTDDGNQTYKWDAFNRLREVYDDTPALIAAYTYDADNRRMRKDLATGTDVDYIYSGWQVLEEYEGGANPERQFVYGNYIDEVLIMDVNEDNDNSCIEPNDDDRYFYHQNTLYSVCGVIDSNGTVIEAYSYDPYGRHILIEDGDDSPDTTVNFSANDTRTTSGASTLGNPYTFTGRNYDSESSLHFYRNRHYNSTWGRFISRDPIGYEGGINLYAYADNCSTNNTDPLGLLSIIVPKYPDMSDFPDTPRNGRMVLKNGTVLSGDFRINPKGGAKGKTNNVFGVDTVSAAEWEKDEKAKLDEMKSRLCDRVEHYKCCTKEECIAEAEDIAATYVKTVKRMRKQFIDDFGWIGKGNAGNSANWWPSSGNTRNRRKFNYYLRHKAPGPLCHQWADAIEHDLRNTNKPENNKPAKPRFKCLKISQKVRITGTHTWMEVNIHISPHNIPGRYSESGHVKLDPWKTARAK